MIRPFRWNFRLYKKKKKKNRKLNPGYAGTTQITKDKRQNVQKIGQNSINWKQI